MNNSKIFHLFILLVLVNLPMFETYASDKLDNARNAVTQWVEVEKTISTESIEWEEKKQLLNDLIAVAQADINRMKSQIDEAKAATDLSETRRKELVLEKEKNAVLSGQVKDFLGPFESKISEMSKRFPKPLRLKLEPMLARIPGDPEKATSGIASRMQVVIGILTEIQRFDRSITTDEELLDLPEGGTLEIYTIHFGLGASYYISSDGAQGGVGVAASTGWQWEQRNELVKSIKQAIDLTKGKSMQANFLPLPVKTNKTIR